MTDQAKYFHTFNLIEELGSIAFKKLLNFFPDLQTAWQAQGLEFQKAGLSALQIQKIKNLQKKANPDNEVAKIKKQGIEIITIADKDYPANLKEIYNPPALLYIKGRLEARDKDSLAIVGTRKLSLYGQQITPKIVADLTRAGLTIVSGLARGIDTLAHQTALATGGRTIAVLGSGLSNIYPPENKKLVASIIQHGAIISEFVPDTPPHSYNFPQRNRIVAGLALGTLVIEAPLKSGSLITAREALEQNREVFAIPGQINTINAQGTNALIKMGAKLTTSAQDILEELNLNFLTQIAPKQITADNPEEALILKILTQEPIHIDQIANQTKLNISTLNAHLITMEIRGKVRNLGAGNYVIN